MKKNLLIAALVALASVGCATAAPRVSAPVTMTGKLVLKGSMPMVRVVLIRSDSEQWELQDVPAATASALQNKAVIVEGVVAREPSSGMLPASLRVTKISPAAEGAAK